MTILTQPIAYLFNDLYVPIVIANENVHGMLALVESPNLKKQAESPFANVLLGTQRLCRYLENSFSSFLKGYVCVRHFQGG